MSKITFTQGDIKLGNLSDDEIEMIKDLIKYFNGCKIGHEIDVCLKKFQNDYYFSVPICVSEDEDGPIYIDQRISETPFVFDDLCMPNDLISIKFLRDKFVSSSFKRTFSLKKEDYTKNYSKDYIEIFYTELSNTLHDCEPHPFEFSPSLYEIYPKYESKYEEKFSIFKVPDNVKKERIDISKSFVWYLHTQLKYKSMSSKTFPSMSVAVDAVTEKLDYYNPDKPPTDEPNKWQKVVHRFRTEWIPADEYPAITPAAAPWNEDVVLVD